MKLQKQFSREVEGEEYHKWTVVLPPSQIEELEWKEGDQLESVVSGGELILRPIEGEEEEKKMSSEPMTPYEEFKETVKEVLEDSDEGMTWSEIKEEGGLPQKVPNNVWVSQLEDEIGLVRGKEAGRTVWKLSH